MTTTQTAPTTTAFDDHAVKLNLRQYTGDFKNETLPEHTFRRVADWVAGAEAPAQRLAWAQKYYRLMADKKFCPGGRVLAGAGTNHGNVLNCFVQSATEHDARTLDGVMEIAMKLALVTKVGGGNGVNIDVYAPQTVFTRRDTRVTAVISSDHADVDIFIAGLMTPANQPDGQKVPTALKNIDRAVVIGHVPLNAEQRQQAALNGVALIYGEMSSVGDHVISIPDNLGGIVDAAHDLCRTLAAKPNAQVILNLSPMRAEGTPIKGSGGTSSGPFSFLVEIFDNFLEWHNRGAEKSGPVNTLRYIEAPVLRVVRQGGSRRGAGMATIDATNPSILDFLTAKDLDREEAEGDISTFNISILIGRVFWQALEEDTHVSFPHGLVIPEGKYTWDQIEADGGSAHGEERRIPARWLWREIARHAWSTGEPGLIFGDRVNEFSALKNLGEKYQIRCTNPCVTADTWVQTTQGARQVSQLIGKDFCATVNGKNFDAPGGFWLTGVKPVFKVMTKRGFELRLTGNHKLLKVIKQIRGVQTTVWAETDTLQAGERIMLGDHRSAQGWAGRGNHTEGWLLGSLIGDGTFITDKARPMAALGFWGEGKADLADLAETQLRSLGAVKKLWRSDDETRDRIRLSSEALTELAARYGVVHGLKTITSGIEQSGSRFHQGFLQGLFDADGGVQGQQNKGVSVRLAQSDLGMLKRVQRMLARLGVLSSLHTDRRAAGTRPLPDGKGGLQEYAVKAQHELIISGSNLAVFAEQVGFRDARKAAALADRLGGYSRTLNSERFSDEIVSIEADGEEAVYDVTVETAHSFDANGIMAHNCGEIPLTVGEPCDLGAMNLAAYVKDGVFDDVTFRADIHTCVRFLDDVLEVNVFALEDNRVASQDLRRLGLGVMGMADALILLGLRYDSEAGRDETFRIMKILHDEATAESENLGRERGAYPLSVRADAEDDAKKLRGAKRRVPHAPRRNVAVLTVAPTGTTSMIMGVSSGIEPVFSPFIWRKIGSEYKALVAPLFVDLMNAWSTSNDIPDDYLSAEGLWDWEEVTDALQGNHGSLHGLEWIPASIRDVFVCAHDIAPLDHVRMQGAIQRAFDSGAFIGNSLSKTVNMPNSATVEEIQEAYSEAYRTGCKGVTVYRDGSRSFQVLSTTSKAEEVEVSPETPGYLQEIDTLLAHGAQVLVSMHGGEVQVSPYDASSLVAPERPESSVAAKYKRGGRLMGYTDKVSVTNTADGVKRTFLVTLNELEGRPVEVMVISGRAGDESNADSEALGRVVSKALQYGVPAAALAATLRGINGGLYGNHRGRIVGSKADLIAVSLEDFLDQAQATEEAERTLTLPENITVAETSATRAVQVKPHGTSSMTTCPACKEQTMIREEGCSKCQACGFSRCG